MVEVRVSRIAIEVLALEPTNLDATRVSREAVEVLALEPTNLDATRVSREAVEVLALEPTNLDATRVSRMAIEVLGLEPIPTIPGTEARIISREAIEVLALEPPSLDATRVSRMAVEVLGLPDEAVELVYTRVSREAIEVLSLEPESLDSVRVTRAAIEVLALEPDIPEVIEAESFFWDKKYGGWYLDTHDTASRITASAVFDGDDPDDRLVAFGTSDGAVRIIDVQADTDDGSKIQSEIVLGPFSAGLPDAEARWSQLQTHLASNQAEAAFDWFVSETADVDFDTAVPFMSGILPAGLSDVLYNRARGLYVFLRIRGVGLAWAYESGAVQAALGGRARTRN